MIYPLVYLCNCIVDQIMTKTHFFSNQEECILCFSYFYILKKYPTYNNTIFYSEGDSALLFLHLIWKIILNTFANT